MKILYKGKDGGPNSNVTGFWFIEIKSVFSVALLRFDKGSREEFHNHAFSALSWVLKGMLKEELLHTNKNNYLSPHIWPIYTSKNCFHRVHGLADSTWVLSIRGPWNKRWNEYNKHTGTFTTLTNGRKIVSEKNSNS